MCMSEQENLHAGHRKRLVDKLIENPDALAPHEYLEILLFPLLPRKNTNDIAHRLLKTFGSLDLIFTASPKELMSVDGVGERVAAELVVFGKLFQLLKGKKEEISYATSFVQIKDYLAACFKNLRDEKLLLVLLNKNYKIITKIEYTDNNSESVTADIPEMAKAVAIHKPTYAIIAHNHPSGNANPSQSDDLTTMKIIALCALHGVNLIDHVIVAGNRFYGYNSEGRLQALKENSDIEKYFKTIQGEL